jgi:two-component system, NarL family, sensor histidine kinase EvgS
MHSGVHGLMLKLARFVMGCCWALAAAASGAQTPTAAASAPLPITLPQPLPAPIKVGLLAESHPFHVWLQDGSPQGYDLDLLEALARAGGFKFEFQRFVRWEDLQDALAQGAVDIVTATAMTPQRAQWMRFTRHYASMPQGFAGKRHITSVSAGLDLAGKRLAVARAFATETIAAERFPFSVRLPFNSEGEALAAVSRGEADFVFGGAAGLRALIDERGDHELAVLRTFGFPEGQRRIAARLNRVELIEQLNAAMVKIDAAQWQAMSDRWLARWEAATLTAPAPTDSAAPLKVGYFPASPPYAFTDSQGQAAGVGVELAKAAMQRAGLVVASWHPVSLSQGLERIREGGLDMLVGVTDVIDRQPYMQFVGPYRANPVVIVSRDHAQVSSLDQLAGRRLAMMAGYFGERYVREVHPSIETARCEEIESCLLDVEAGRSDAALMGLDVALQQLEVGRYRNLNVTGMVAHLQDEDNFGLSRARAHLAPRLRDGLQAALNLDLPRIEREWLQRRTDDRMLWSQAKPWLAGAAAVLAALLAAGWWHQRSLKRQIVQTQQARAESEQYLAFMAHEVRNSLQSVAGATVLLRNSDAPDAQQKPLLEALDRSSRSTLGLLNDLLDRHRLHAGAMQIALRPESLEHTLDTVVDEVLPAARAKGLQLHFEPESALSGWWQIDALRLQQVLRNLLVNAVKFSSQGSVRLRASLRASPQGSQWRQLVLNVIDQGPGLTPALQRSVFAGGVTQGGDRPGSGMGLALARELVRAMGGDITVQSPAPQNTGGGGACFTVSVPIQEGQATPPQDIGAPQRLLVVEDSPVYSLLLEEAFTQAGASVLMCETLTKAREALIASVAGAGSTLPAFDLVVSDSRVGDGHVRELLAFMREAVRPGVNLPPVICISAEFSLDEQAELRAAGAIDLLAKDSDVQAFVQRVLTAFAASGKR